MKIYREGEKSKGLCQKCKEIQPTTFKISSVPLSTRKALVENILAACCDQCGHVVSIPHQSSIRIRDVLKEKKRSLEVRVPIHLLDILLLAVSKFKVGSSEQLKDLLVRYYIAVASKDKKILSNLQSLSESDFAKGSSYRLSLKVDEAIYQCFEQLIKQSKLTKTQIIKALILQINQDILQKPVKKRIDDLQQVFLAGA